MQILERILLFVLLVLVTGTGQGVFADPNVTTTSSGWLGIQAVLAVIYLSFFLIILRKFRKTALFLVLKERWTLVLCLWVAASTLWSVGPIESLRHSLALVGTSLAGLYIGMRFEPKQQLKMLALVIGLGAIASLAAGLLVPGVGITPDGAWQGVYYPKNSLGRIMSLGALCFALLALGQRRNRVVRGCMFFLCCALLLLSRSATAVVVCVLMFGLIPFRRILYLRTRPLIGAMIAGGVVATAIVLWTVDHLDQILDSLGRTATLTGRIPLWGIVIKEIAERPLQGYGFSAFFTSWEGERVSDSVAWDVAVPNAHNGFLEVWLGIGLIGLALLAIGMGRSFLFALRRARAHGEFDQSWPLILLVFIVMYNLTETSLLIGNSILWMAYVANSFWLVRTVEEEKHAVELIEEPEHAYST